MKTKKVILVLALVLGMLAFYQNCAKYPYHDSSKATLATVEMKRYYLVDPNYTCVDSQNQTIASYKNSIYIYNGDLCETGDICQNKTDCKPWPTSLVFAPDLQSAQYNGQTYLYFSKPPL